MENNTTHREELPVPYLEFTKWENPYKKKINKEQTERSYEDDDEDDDEDGLPKSSILLTSLGAIPMTALEDVFKFYMLNTNFSLTETIVGLICKVNGVESLEVYSRYRCKIGVGEIFADFAVKERIRAAINKYFDERKNVRANSKPA